MKIMTIPQEVKRVLNQLERSGFEAYLVGGCVRDLLLGTEPKDWDITTNAKPEEILKLFPDSFYENQFGTVGVKSESDDPRLALVEVTTFRKEGKYTDKRHPDSITFAETIEEDLARRDFTVNALALSVVGGMEQKIIDSFGGQQDLKKKLIRAVGNPTERFEEDALRLLRAVRFAAQLNFKIEKQTAEATKEKASSLEFISKERIRDEFTKLLMTEYAVSGIKTLLKLGVLRYVAPELEEGFNMDQNRHHKYTVFEHLLRSLEYSVKNNHSLEVRLASLLHDVGKPRTRVWKEDSRGEKVLNGQRGDWTFYQHQYVGEKIVMELLGRLHFTRRIIEHVALLVREHMFVYDPEAVTERGVRRLVRRVGVENIDDLFKVREADRIGSGVPKAQPYRLRHLRAMIEKVKTDPISVKQLTINGDDVMREANIQPGPHIGQILSILLDEVLDDPDRNKREYLVGRIKELGSLSEADLVHLAEKAREKTEQIQARIDDAIKQKYFVK